MEVDENKNHMVYEDNGDGTMTCTIHVKELGLHQTILVEVSFNDMMAGIVQSLEIHPELGQMGEDFMNHATIIPDAPPED